MQLWAQIRSWADAALVVALAALYLTSFELESPINGFVLPEGSEDDFEALEVFDQDTRFIIEALEKAIEAQVAWSPGFLQELSAAAHDEDGRDLIDQMVQAIAANRTRKTHPGL